MAIAKCSMQTALSQVGHQSPQTRAHHCGPAWRFRLVYSIARHLSQVEARVLECAEQAGVKLWSRRCREQQWKLANYSVDCTTQDKDWKTNQHMECANANVLPMEKFGRLEGNRHIFFADTDTYMNSLKECSTRKY